MASRALSARLRIAVVSWLGSTIATQFSSSNTDSIWICSPSVGRNSFAVSTTSELMSISRGWSGCLRAKASRCWVRSAPRAAASSIILVIAASCGSFAALQRGDAQLGLEFLAVAAATHELAAAIQRPAVLVLQELHQARPDSRTFAFGDDEVDRALAEHLVAAPAEELFGLGIPVQDVAGLVGLDEGVERSLDDVAGEPFAL